MQIKHFQKYVGSKPVSSSSDRITDMFNPATGKVTGKIPLATVSEVDGAVAAANVALPAWSAMTPLRRARVL